MPRNPTSSSWKVPPTIKLYEALGCIADKRITLEGNTARVQSSSRGKTYNVFYNPEEKSITSNDNGSYYQGYLGYPAIAFLMTQSILPFKEEFAEALKGIPWKNLNTRYKNNYEKTLAHVHEIISKKTHLNEFLEFIDVVHEAIKTLKLKRMNKKLEPPQGY